MINPPTSAPMVLPYRESDAALLANAKRLEAAFLAELLGFSGLGKTENSFSGGIGEDQFSSFLRAEQAKLMAERGGIGLAELIFNSLKTRQGSGHDSD